MFILLTLVAYLAMLLVRGTLPRYRIDMLVQFVWKINLFTTIIIILLTTSIYLFVN